MVFQIGVFAAIVALLAVDSSAQLLPLVAESGPLVGPYGGPFSGRFSTPFGGPWAGAYRGASIIPFFGPYVGPRGFGATGPNGFDLNTSAESRRSFRARSALGAEKIAAQERQAIDKQKELIKAQREDPFGWNKPKGRGQGKSQGYGQGKSQVGYGKSQGGYGGKGQGRGKGQGKGKGRGNGYSRL